ncbi:MAG: choline dehydrogenase [Gammaproteobacteria bacterium]|nr:MAG: choline dehydrogenase [Gammaproteobacteria bacterium]
MESCDYVIIGAGSAGCVLANRLSADPGVTVHLLEAGGSDAHDLIRMPVAWMRASEKPEFSWGQVAGPEIHAGERLIPQTRGRLLGGSSSINGMMYIRGRPEDYDAWGLPGWRYADLLPYFRRSEDNWRGESRWHGSGGPMRVGRLAPDPDHYPALLAAAQALGYREIPDFSAAEAEGFGLPDFTTWSGQRVSTATAFLKPARQRRNLRIVTAAQATRVLLEGRRAAGVEYLQDGEKKTIRAIREVILCAGAFNSPQLLQISGIGPAKVLHAAGIPRLHELPGVGANLQDHPMILAAWQAREPRTFERHLRLDRLLLAAIRWKLFGTGPLAVQPMSIQGFLKSEPGLDRPDTQFQVIHVSYMARPWFPWLRPGAGHQISSGALLLNPESRGSVNAVSIDPRVAPSIHLNLLEKEADLWAMMRMFRFMRRFFATGPAAELVTGEVVPGPEVDGDAGIEAYIRAAAITGMHSSGTCAMGNDPMSVVDPELKVHGIDGLRVADASIMPRIVRGNTNAPAIMIAEKAADLILGKTPPPPVDTNGDPS